MYHMRYRYSFNRYNLCIVVQDFDGHFWVVHYALYVATRERIPLPCHAPYAYCNAPMQKVYIYRQCFRVWQTYIQCNGYPQTPAQWRRMWFHSYKEIQAISHELFIVFILYILLWLPMYLLRTSCYQVPCVINGIWKL